MNSYQPAIEKLRAELDRHKGGRADPDAIRAVHACADALTAVFGYDSYVEEKMGDLKRLASDLFSARKHQRYRNESGSGASILLSRMHGILDRLSDWPETRARMNLEKKSGI